MTPLTVQLLSTRRDWADFVRLKENIYLPLTGERESAREEVRDLKYTSLLSNSTKRQVAFLARRGEEPVGRIVAMEDSLHPKSHQGFFGFFECIEDPKAARCLLEAAGNQLKQWNKTEMLGPISGSTNEKVGIIIQGFQTLPQEYLTYNPSYYQQLLEGAGLVKAMDLFSYLWHDLLPLPPKVLRVAKRIKNQSAIRLYFPPLQGQKEARDFQSLYNESLAGNWGFIPLSLEEARNLLSSYQRLPDPELLLRMDVEGEPAGFCLMLLNSRKNLQPADPKLRIAVLGLKPRFRKTGLSAVLILEILEIITRKGHRSAELSLIMENNRTVRSLIENTFQCPVLHQYRVYSRSL
ncbi:MAG TPA: GNAT family N-acetyltransferase [Clostridia bacterium]|nr:GNAT family N-acetyltransferase [Clostridia bacterium]